MKKRIIFWDVVGNRRKLRGQRNRRASISKLSAISALGAAVLAGVGVSETQAAVLADWTFETSLPTGNGPYAPEINNTTPSNTAAATAVIGGTKSSPAGNGSAHSYSSNGWSVGNYFQFSLSTTGYSKIGISFDQGGSNTGPRDFKVQYSTNGTTFTDFQTYSLNNAGFSTTTANPALTYSFDLSSISALNNNANVAFRLVDTSTISINGSTVAPAGSDRVDNFTVSEVPEPATIFGGVLLVGAAGLQFRRRSGQASRLPFA